MDPAQSAALRALIENQQTAALATLHKGDPAISMVPYALLPAGRGFVIHVSRLATHTADLQAHPRVALLVTAPPGSAATARELERAGIRGEARRLDTAAPEYGAARACYLARFPQSEPLFAFADFSLFLIEVHSVRFVAGFARAWSVTATNFSSVMAGGA